MTIVTRPVVVLFDVDETLIHSGGSGTRSWKAAFEKLYGISADIGAHSTSGETDPQIAKATALAVLGRVPSEDELVRLYVEYLLHLSQDILISPEYRVMPHVEKLLTSLGEAGVILGIVSGAMEGAARTKLLPGNLNRFFVFGAYGSDSTNRGELTKIAIGKATLLHSELVPAQVFVVGDTPNDMKAAIAAEAVPVGVATGTYSIEELRAAGGVHVLGSFEEPFPGLMDGEERIAVIDALAAEQPTDDPIALYERASAQDSYGSEYVAEGLYKSALANGLADVDVYRTICAHVQLASTLRNLGRYQEAVALLGTAQKLDLSPDQQNWVRTFQLLCNLSQGLDVADSKSELSALIPILTKYQISVTRFAKEFGIN